MKNKILQLIIFFLFVILIPLQTHAQGDRIISGKITSYENNKPLQGVNIMVKDTDFGTVSDNEGNYKIYIPANNATLVFSKVGHAAEEIEVKDKTTIDVEMILNLTELAEVVATSFGIEQEKKALTYAVQEVPVEEITNTQKTNLIDALQGKVAGVYIQSTGGAPGAGSSIIIRGINSLSPTTNNQPLFVIDGIPISNETIATNVLPSTGSNSPGSNEQFAFSNRTIDLNPDDIESLSILKGPAATALYGLRAANGAVVITTKKGGNTKPSVSFYSYVGFDQINKTPEIQTTYGEGRYGLKHDPSGIRFWTFGPPVQENEQVYNNFKNLFRTGQRLNNGVSVSGGNNKASYYSSFSRLDQTGIAPNSQWARTTFRLAGSIQAFERLRIEGGVSYTNSGGNRPQGGDKSMMSALSFYTTMVDVNDYLNPDGTQKDYSGGIIDNPRYVAEVSSLKDNVNRVFGNIGLSYTANNWLSIDYKLGSDFYHDTRKRIAPPGLDISGSESGGVNGFVVEDNINYQEINSNFFVTLKKTWGQNWNSSLILGQSLTDIQYNQVTIRGEGYTLPGFNDLSNMTNFFPSLNSSRRGIVGVFADAKINYKGKLFLNLTGRNDWSSTLPKGNRSFFYPSVGLSYVFYESIRFFNYGKVRLSWAQVGKDAPPYLIGRYYETTSGFPFGNVNGFTLSNIIGAENLKPETTNSIEGGINLIFFNHRLEVDATYFIQRSTDQIIPIPVSLASGYDLFLSNAGEIENRGVELITTINPVKRGTFSWEISGNWTMIDSKVRSMPDGVDEIIFAEDRIVNKLVEGGSVGDLYGWDYKRDGQGNLLIDNNGFPSLDRTKMVKVGNALPDWVAGITNTLSWRGISLSCLLEIKQGGDIYDLGRRNGIRNGILKITEQRYEQVIFDGIKEENGQQNDITVELNEANIYRSEDRYNEAAEVLLQDASWIRLRNVNLSYTFPRSIINETPFEKAKIFIYAHNLLLITPYSGYDPDGNSYGAGSNSFGYAGLNIPQTKGITAGLSLVF